ncbi:DUF624 domain-containing protein [Schleiferilactobacillus shenzhenensis]|uniref:DUF624 domain-containing protein n=1 Tax=Schleiferilactobacillus shenzhenensis LY-73 TaxID=1231336 RepID=U4TQK6_9LACO|nr:DUF624 domain-containing protein [Schleiferilactobacillus shenzhenensis]ERL65725.1 hypothetical protein L248_2411 [Schleiferilactobacillus shenzhenensis LY-73]
MNEPRGIIRLSVKVGQILLLGVKLQLLFLLFALRGAVVLGVFPALAACAKLILRRMEKRPDEVGALFGTARDTWPALYAEFRTFYQQAFWEMNGIGYLGLLAVAALVVDLAVNQAFLHSAVLQWGLIVLLVGVLSYWLYVLTIYARYQLHFWQYFRQALIISVAHFTNTLAIVIGSVAATALLVLFPALSLVALVPLYLTPTVWFSYQSCQRVEAVMHYAA